MLTYLTKYFIFGKVWCIITLKHYKGKYKGSLKYMNKIKEFILNHRLLFTVGFVVVGAFGIFMPQMIFNHDFTTVSGNKITGIEIVAYSAEIVSALYLILGTIIAVWQYYISSKKHLEKMQRDQIQKAIDLAGYYKDNILSNYATLKMVYKKSGLQDILDKINIKEIKSFDNLELTELLSEDDINDYKKLLNSEKFVKSVFEVYQLLGLDLKGCRIKTEEVSTEDNHKKISFEVNPNQLANDFLKNCVSNVLNNAELFAMYFIHNIADESVIFQSIYPTYLELCNTLYYDIARCSVPGKARLYTNLTGLYNIWKEKAEQQNANAKTTLRNNSSDYGTIANNKN